MRESFRRQLIPISQNETKKPIVAPWLEHSQRGVFYFSLFIIEGFQMPESHAQRMAAAWKRCDIFNRNVTIGAKCIYRPVQGSDDGAIHSTIESDAFVLQNAEPLVMIAANRGGVSIDHIEIL